MRSVEHSNVIFKVNREEDREDSAFKLYFETHSHDCYLLEF